MGIDYYVCDACGEPFPDCGGYSCCEDCDATFCAYCDKGEQLMELDVDEITKDNCPVCLKEIIPDEAIMTEALKQLGKTKEQITIEIKEAKGDE